MARGGAREGAGRKAGVKDRATIEAELAAAKQQLEQARQRDSKGHKLAVEVLNDVMHVAYGMMAKHQPLAPNEVQVAGRDPNVGEFKEWLKITREAAGDLAPYQSSKFKSVTFHQEAPIGNTVPENPTAERVSPAEAYRMLRDSSTLIELTPTASVTKLPAPKKRAKG